MKRFLSSYPFLSAATVQAAIALAIALGWHLTPVQTGSIEAAAAAVLAVLVAASVRPFPVPLFTGALTAIGTLLVAFRAPHITAGGVSAFVAFLAALLGGFGHQAVSTKLGLRERQAAVKASA
jgi:hypothetical protein